MRQEKQITAHEEGASAFLRGVRLLDNPYKVGTDEHMHWQNGWMVADDHLLHLFGGVEAAKRARQH